MGWKISFNYLGKLFGEGRILINALIAQFINFESNIDLRQIRESDRLYFQDTRTEVNNFYNINIFGTDINDLEIEGSLHLIIESIVEVDNQKVVNAQAILTNRNDIIMTLKTISFPISQLKDISFNPNNFKSFFPLILSKAPWEIPRIKIKNKQNTIGSKFSNL